MLRLLKAASDSASCLRTAATVNREIGMPNVDLVCREINRTITSVSSLTSFSTPMYLPPPASTIEEISSSFKTGSILFEPLFIVPTSNGAGASNLLRQLRRRRLKRTADEPMLLSRLKASLRLRP
jgi:hypothetical protein